MYIYSLQHKKDKEIYYYHNKFSSYAYPTFDEAVLGWLEYTYLGLNNQFALFASKMLGIHDNKQSLEK